MNINPSDFYNYFKECYKLDYKEFNVENLLSTKYRFKWFVKKKEEFLYEGLPLLPYDNSKQNELESELNLYKLEKKLFYASFFVLGANDNHLAKDKRFCSPLILHPVTIKTIDEYKFLEIDKSDFTVNRTVLSKLELQNESKTKDQFLNQINELLHEEFPDYLHLKTLLDAYFSNLDTQELLLFPTVWSVVKIRKFFTEHTFEENNYKIIPAAGTCILKKSESSLRVLNDLNEMASKEKFNSSLEELIGRQSIRNTYKESYFNSRLNSGQYNALRNAHIFNNSVIVGPPGTGKTYTISSIVADAVVKNQSILVVSKTKHAVEVIRDMLQNEFKLKDYLIHTTGRQYKTSLKAKIKRYLSGISGSLHTDLNEDHIKHLFEKLKETEQEFEASVERELEISKLDFSKKLSFFNKWKLYYKKFKAFGDDKIWDVFEDIETQLELLEKETHYFSKKKIQQNIGINSDLFRSDISLFHDALDAYNFSEYKRIISKVFYQNIIKVFPIWLANLSDLNSILPLKENLFDIVIIDEATQCDVATALPALYRAKRSVIVGDPNQLRHYSFVSRAQQQNLRQRLNIPENKIFDYRSQSVLDLFISKVKSQKQISFLREHFRSTPSIIEFSNRHFYEGQLQILKSTPKHTTHKQIKLIDIHGSRNKKGVNEIEAQQAIAIVKEMIQDYDGAKTKPSIGIISPFSTQVNYIKNLLREQFDLSTLRRFKVLCGTPYNFQGNEREIIILSFTVCDNSHSSAFVHVAKPEVLNVAITRAKSFQYVLKSVSDTKLKDDSLLNEYFRFIKEFSHIKDINTVQDEFQKQIIKALKQLSYKDVRLGYPLAGNLLDILVFHRNTYFFIDLIGYPGKFEDAFSLERYKTLARTGIKSLPIHYSLWKKNPDLVIKRLEKFLG